MDQNELALRPSCRLKKLYSSESDRTNTRKNRKIKDRLGQAVRGGPRTAKFCRQKILHSYPPVVVLIDWSIIMVVRTLKKRENYIDNI